MFKPFMQDARGAQVVEHALTRVTHCLDGSGCS
jgi:Flp pilus assembly pilin Flp